jgi:hypothetical protein
MLNYRWDKSSKNRNSGNSYGGLFSIDKPFKMISCLRTSHHPFPRYEIWSLYIEYRNQTLLGQSKQYSHRHWTREAWTIKGNIKMFNFLRQSMAQMCQVIQDIGMLNAAMSTRAVAAQLNVQCSNIARLWEHFQQTGRTANRSHWRRPRATITAQYCYIRLVHLRDLFWQVTRTADETVDVKNRRISAQTVRNRLQEAELHVRRPHRGLDRTDVLL